MDNEGTNYQCFKCGANVPADARFCPHCGASIMQLEQQGIMEIPISNDLITKSTIESLLKANNIEYSIENSFTDSVSGHSITQFSKILIRRDQNYRVEKILKDYKSITSLSTLINITGSFETDKKVDDELIREDLNSEHSPQIKIGGYLLFFAIFLIFLLPFINLPFNIFYFYEVSNSLRWYPMLGQVSKIVVVVSVLVVLYGIYTGILIWRIHSDAVRYANIFLNIYIAYSILTFFTAMASIPFKDIQSSNIILGLFKYLFRVTLFSLAIMIHWKIYLKKSRRVKETFNIYLN